MSTVVVPQASSVQRAGWLTRVPRAPAVFAVFVTAIAGYFDAVGYIQLGHLYVSFMSGNSTHLGMALAAGAWGDVVLAALVVGAFVLGAGLGTIVADRSEATRVGSVLLAELLVLLAAFGLALSINPDVALIGVAVAMGMQNAAHQLIAGADIGRSFITGALFSLGQALAKVFEGNKSDWRTIGVLAVSWLAFVCGVVVGSLTLATVGLQLSLTLGVGMLATTTGLVLLGLL
jgi:uncharacterized membrane protein YoaK (UPF0700 family)